MFKDDLVKAALMMNVFYSIGYPTVQKILYTAVNEKYIALNAIVLCIATICSGKIWGEYREKIYKRYGSLLILKVVFYTILLVLILNKSINYKAYYIADTLIMAVISKNVIFGSNTLKSIRYSQSTRNIFDNRVLIAGSVSSLAGLSVSLFCKISASTAFIFLTLGMAIDSIIYYRVFLKSKQKNAQMDKSA